MPKEKRCLKFTGYIYMPNNNATAKDLRYYASRTPGRLIIFDEFNGKPTEKAYAFDNLGDAFNQIEQIRKKRICKRVKT